MRNASLLVLGTTVLGPLAGCIVSDELSTLTIAPSGAADWVKLQSNIRSSEPGERGAEELRRFVKAFEEHRDEDYVRLQAAGAKILEARWLRHEEPYSSILVARLPDARTLEAFLTLRDDKGEVIAQPRFTEDGKRRRLSLTIPVPKDQKVEDPGAPTLEWLRGEQASGLSATRVAVTGGHIVAARGCTVAADKRSALLGAAEVRELLRSAKEQVELFLEWELD